MKKLLAGLSLLALATTGGIPAAFALGTEAGTEITNTANARWKDPDNVEQTASSNPSSLTVDELLDVAIASNDGGNVRVAAGDTDKYLTFQITNTGNGPEQYVLSVNSALPADQFDPTGVEVYFDTNGNGIFDPLTDLRYVPSGVVGVAGNEPMLDPDQVMVVFVVADIPATDGAGDPLGNNALGLVRVTAESLTAQETPEIDDVGHVFEDSGAGGTDAVLGASQGYQSSQNGFVISQLFTRFTKTSEVFYPGAGGAVYGSNPIPGSYIKYTLTFEVTGSGTMTEFVIEDPIPENTSFIVDDDSWMFDRNNDGVVDTRGGIKVNGTQYTDVRDSDIAEYDTTVVPRRVLVQVPTVTAPQTYVVEFYVKIN